jgi:anti-sigma regulatory factor (Ser/Thr protein kinase)
MLLHAEMAMPHRGQPAGGQQDRDYDMTGGQMKAMVMVPGRAEVVPALRALLGCLLAGHPALDDVCLMATEVIGNAIRHTRSGGEGGTLTVTVIDTGDLTRVEVIDQGGTPSSPHVREAAAGSSESGYGLRLVSALAASWDAISWGEGIKTWFEA